MGDAVRSRPERERAGGLGVGLGSARTVGAFSGPTAVGQCHPPVNATATAPADAPPPAGGWAASTSAREAACARQLLLRCGKPGAATREGTTRAQRQMSSRAKRQAHLGVKAARASAARASADRASATAGHASQVRHKSSCVAAACAQRVRPPSPSAVAAQAGEAAARVCSRAQWVRRPPVPHLLVLFGRRPGAHLSAQTPPATAHAHGVGDTAAGVACTRTARVSAAPCCKSPFQTGP